MIVYIVSWSEYEKDWSSRPDGYSLHTSKEKRDAYIKIRENDAVNDKYHDIEVDDLFTIENDSVWKRVKAAGGNLAVDAAFWD